MARVGRPSPERENEIKSIVYRLVGDRPPGTTFGEMVEAGKLRGVTRPTIWRHLRRYVALGLILHEGKYYRRDPLHRFTSWLPPYANDAEDRENLRQDTSVRIAWELRNVQIDSIAGPEELKRKVRRAIELATWAYLDLLWAIRGARSRAAARELATLLMDSMVNQSTMFLAREVWDSRDKVPLEVLDGKRLTFSVSWHAPEKRPQWLKEITHFSVEYKP